MGVLEHSKPKEDNSKWVALSADEKQEVLFEDKDIYKLIELADKSGKAYITQYVPDPSRNFIF